MSGNDLITVDREIPGGTPVFRGTRGPERFEPALLSPAASLQSREFLRLEIPRLRQIHRVNIHG